MFAIDLSSVFLFEDLKRIKISHESLVEKEKEFLAQGDDNIFLSSFNHILTSFMSLLLA